MDTVYHYPETVRSALMGTGLRLPVAAVRRMFRVMNAYSCNLSAVFLSLAFF